MASLVLRNVGKSYGSVEVIHDLNLGIHEGEFLVLVGPSGCGKSTLLRMIAGLEEITEGTISIGDTVVNDLPASKRELSMVFQSYALYPHMSVRKNLAFGLQNMKKTASEIARRVDDAARILRIENLMDRKPRQLSGGQKQRVAIGRAIVREPKLFLFDEPLSNLDAELRVQMRAELAALYNKLGTTMIYVTHDQVEAMTMASRIVVLRGGRIEQVGTPKELYLRPANLFVAGFIGSPRINLFEARAHGTTQAMQVIMADFAGFTVKHHLTDDTPLTVGIRPEALRLGEGQVRGTGVIEFIEYLGSEILLHARTESGLPVSIQISGKERHDVGESIEFGFDPSEAHLFDPSGQRIITSADRGAL